MYNIMNNRIKQKIENLLKKRNFCCIFADKKNIIINQTKNYEQKG